MATVLLTWNPSKWDWYRAGELPALASRCQRGLPAKYTWSVSRTKHVREGDRVFMLKQGAEPRGIMGSGRAVSDWFPGRDWRPDRKRSVVHYVEVEFDALLDPKKDELLPVARLQRGAGRHVHWAIQFSGMRVRDDAARELEHLWQKQLQRKRVTPALTQRGGGAGFGRFENNKKVQVAAVRHVTAVLRKADWTVENVENLRCGFDLRCRRGDQELHVEVKGASGPEQRFIITPGEVAAAEDDPVFQLHVVTGALFRGRKSFVYTGERFLRTFALEPIQYKAIPSTVAKNRRVTR